jgi:hypothetical protein
VRAAPAPVALRVEELARVPEEQARAQGLAPMPAAPG